MPLSRLSALDASFLAVESPSSPMHVGWVARFDAPEEGPRPRFSSLAPHIAGRIARGAPRYRQRLVDVPLGLHEPVWIDDPEFDPAQHVRHARGRDLDRIVDEILSVPLARDRPLWEIWVADGLEDGVVLVGKAHHCMVDGVAITELARVLLDGPRAPDPVEAVDAAPASPAVVPSGTARLARAVADRAADGATLALAPLRLAASPSLLRAAPRSVAGIARTASETVLPPAPASPLNRPGSPRRHHVRVTRSLDEVRAVRRRFGVTPNDVVLAACAGALRRFCERRGEEPQSLKVMVPADVRSSSDEIGAGNRISFVFIELPCDEPDPRVRLAAIADTTASRREHGTAETLDAAFRALALTPRSLQRVLAHAFAHPRLSNLTISSVPGPAVPRFLKGCRLREVHSAVPLAGSHAVSIGVVLVAGHACFGIYADAETLPDAAALGEDLHAAMDELVALD